MLTKMRRHGDSIALTKGLLIAVRRLRHTGPALSVIASQCQSSELTAESIYAAKYSALLSRKAASEQ